MIMLKPPLLEALLWGSLLLIIPPCFAGAKNKNEEKRTLTIYDPLKGVYIDSFQDSSKTTNCSLYLVSPTMFLLDECNATSPFARSLEFFLEDEKIGRVAYTPIGTLLEIPKELPLEAFENELHINIKSKFGPRFCKKILLDPDKYFNSIPSKQGLYEFNSRHLKSSNYILVMNSKTFVIFNLVFDNYFQHDSFFWVGKGSIPNRNGIKIPDEYGSLKPLRDYYNETIILKLPGLKENGPDSEAMTVQDIDYLSIYSPEIGHVYDSIPIDHGPHIGFLHPAFYFDKYFFGKEKVLCLPTGSFSRELGFSENPRKETPCLGAVCSEAPNRTVGENISYAMVFCYLLIIGMVVVTGRSVKEYFF